jgi:uncharacterized protein (UPF0548 family)
MNLTLGGRPPTLASCARWKHAIPSTPTSGPANPTVDRYVTSVRLRSNESPEAAFARTRARLLAYKIFPPSLLRSATCPEGPIRHEATIIQRFQFGPLALEAAVRVIDVWDRQERGVRDAGFRYVTLQGHPECGIATFRVHQDESGVVTIIIEANSQPGVLVTRLARPISRALQQRATQAALRYLAED